ncbi:hypothetical protein LPTSP3_g12290 [Leptospira kobayashii]|uniref:Uncharacterized protein n=1 Tax=Leptospira kobayashii TaxID=1917830 RepID=A0ABM7URW0_9LEPT|nr:hypothetical protein LPTSP3_g12290 [Leptospira kobayashii]
MGFWYPRPDLGGVIHPPPNESQLTYPIGLGYPSLLYAENFREKFAFLPKDSLFTTYA